MDYGVHLPVIDFGFHRFSLKRFSDYVRKAEELGFQAVTTNDHLIYSRPWIDAPTALAAVLSSTKTMAVGTSVTLPIVRGPVPMAKALAAIDILSNGRLFVGVGPGSSPLDYAIVGMNYEERWKRFDEVIQLLRALWTTDKVQFSGRYYSSGGNELEPKPVQRSGPPIWIGSWGSDAGLRRVARLGDGWLASAYNTTPSQFRSASEKLSVQLRKLDKNPETFPNMLVTMFMYVTENRKETDRVLSQVLVTLLDRPVEELRERLLVGPPEVCAEKLAAYQAAGVQRVFVWPVMDELDQLTVFLEKVAPLVRT